VGIVQDSFSMVFDIFSIKLLTIKEFGLLEQYHAILSRKVEEELQHKF